MADQQQGDANRLWVVHVSNNKKIEERAQKEGFLCIGWTKLGDLSERRTPEAMKAAYQKAFPEKSEASVRSSYMQVFKFAHDMQIGELVVYPIKASRDVLIGRIASDYEWSTDSELRAGDYCNVRRVDWLKRVQRVQLSQDALRSFGSFSSVSTADDHFDEVQRILAHVEQGSDDADSSSAPVPAGISEASHSDLDEAEDEAISIVDEAIQTTKDYLIRRWSRTAQEFEEVVAAVFRALGYTAIVQPGTRDLGVDVIAHADPLGVNPPIIKIQAKSGTSTCGAPVVKQLRGVLNTGEKGIVVSLGGFSADARHTEQNDANLILLDAERFVSLFLSSYDTLSAEMRHRFPLQQVYVVTG